MQTASVVLGFASISLGPTRGRLKGGFIATSPRPIDCAQWRLCYLDDIHSW